MKGIYILTIFVKADLVINVGALGPVAFERGFYAYVGSAQKNLEKRLKRYVEGAEKKFWHIDYILAEKHVKIVKIFYKDADRYEECLSAQKLGRFGFAIANFGCSDCKCMGHLFKFESYSSLKSLCIKLGFIPFSLSSQGVTELGNI